MMLSNLLRQPGMLQTGVLSGLMLLAGAHAARADAPQAAVPEVTVPGTLQDRDEKSYRDLLAAMDVFEKNQHMAPGASLRFKVLPRQAGVAMDGLVLRISGEHTNLTIPLAPDHTFTVPRNVDASGDNAMVRFNRKASSLAWRADIRSPGLPPNSRRLGDLLLECKVAFAGDLIAYAHHPLNVLVMKLEDPCRTIPITLYQFADRPVFSVTLVAGKRRSILPAALLHGPAAPMMPSHEDWMFLRERVYSVKFKSLYENGWLDDTLLQFDYMDDDAPVAPSAQTSTKLP